VNCRTYVNPLDFGKHLLGVEKPVRYVGGEYGRLARKSAALQTVIAFPDLYEIGMSNQALRIMYNRLNGIDDVSCDRAFMPAPDFRAFLKRNAIPLYGLDTGVALGDVDALMFTLGYELGITNALAMLELAGVPLHADERKENAPIVIMGGPCASNPLPYARFIDAFWIGEAESGFFELMERIAALKIAGAGKAAMLALMVSHPSVWTGDRRAPVRRAVDADFSRREASAAVFPVPNMKVVQHHGAVEIMRGCPNGCRFCHAGYWYRPMRQKPAEIIEKEAAAFIKEGGYHEISLSSLSSGDYNGLESLIDSLNAAHMRDHISFQLPSLRVSTFSLPLLDKISKVRKSGLTFAIETPVDSWQMMINKEVSRENVINILLEAKKKGWRGAKFYFMIGLPIKTAMEESESDAYTAQGEASFADEEVEIVDFTLEVARRTNMHFNVNVGTFIPKPHTPFQWAKQLDEAASRQKLEFIRNKLQPLGHKVGVQDAFISVIEGVLSRGDDRVGAVIEDAFNKGCCLDAWSEYLNKDAWRSVLEDHKELVEEIFAEKDAGDTQSDTLPWRYIGTGMAKGYLHKELMRSKAEETTSICIEKCKSLCGNCNNDHVIVKNIIHDNKTLYKELPDRQSQNSAYERPSWRIIFSFSKKEEAVFYSHLSLMEIFYMAFLRAGVPVQYSQGFNPLPKLEIAAPLSIGVTGNGEVALIDTQDFFDSAAFVNQMNRKLPKGLRIADAIAVLIPIGEKKRSLSSLLWGYEYRNNEMIDVVQACNEKEYRRERVGEAPVYGLERLSVLAKDICGAGPETGASYFKVYKALYPAACGPENGVDRRIQT
jgi:radical SAM family uncharacterized protein